MLLDEVYLEAVNPDRNCMRSYRLTLTRDLFGVFMVEARYGRIGTNGHGIVHSFEDEATARDYLQECLHRRQSAPRRIGVAYASPAGSGS